MLQQNRLVGVTLLKRRTACFFCRRAIYAIYVVRGEFNTREALCRCFAVCSKCAKQLEFEIRDGLGSWEDVNDASYE